MGIPIMCYGKSGAGKSYSLNGFKGDEIVYFNTMGKPLPFRGRLPMEIKRVTDYRKLMSLLKKSAERAKVIVIDDAGYLQTSMFMAGHSQPKKGSTSFDLFNDISDSMWQLMLWIIDELAEDVRVYLMFHEMSNDYGEVKVRTIGKLLDEKCCLEGMCTIVLHAVVDGDRHVFRVQASGMDIAKSPAGMFAEETIDNDLKKVDDAIKEYYEFGGEKK